MLGVPQNRAALVAFTEDATNELNLDARMVQLAAQRFANYWNSRKEIFGPKTYLSKMTLSEIFNEQDMTALESSAFRLLPLTDCSERQLILFDPCSHTREGYKTVNVVCDFRNVASAFTIDDFVRIPDLNILFCSH